jgi:hypothetical protein
MYTNPLNPSYDYVFSGWALKTVHFAYAVYLYVVNDPHIKQRLFTCTAYSDLIF